MQLWQVLLQRSPGTHLLRRRIPPRLHSTVDSRSSAASALIQSRRSTPEVQSLRYKEGHNRCTCRPHVSADQGNGGSLPV